MSYLNHAQDPRRRATAFAGTVAVHAALGLAVVTGLTIVGYGPTQDYRPTLDFPVDQPPPPPPEPRTQPEAATESVITAPPRPIDLVIDNPLDEVAPVDDTKTELTFFPDPRPVEPAADPRPTGFTPARARPRNNPGSWLSPDDYPRAPLVEGIEGSAAYRLIVSTNGKVSACEITRSTGNPQLDAATCKYIERRARFEPAIDETGAKVVGAYTGTVKWEIPE